MFRTTGVAAKLSIVTQPAPSGVSGVPLERQPVLQLLDADGNPAARAGVVVTVQIATGGGELDGTTSVASDAAGVVTFTDLAIRGSPGIRTLIFAADAFASVASAPIAVGRRRARIDRGGGGRRPVGDRQHGGGDAAGRGDPGRRRQPGAGHPGDVRRDLRRRHRQPARRRPPAPTAIATVGELDARHDRRAPTRSRRRSKASSSRAARRPSPRSASPGPLSADRSTRLRGRRRSIAASAGGTHEHHHGDGEGRIRQSAARPAGHPLGDGDRQHADPAAAADQCLRGRHRQARRDRRGSSTSSQPRSTARRLPATATVTVTAAAPSRGQQLGQRRRTGPPGSATTVSVELKDAFDNPVAGAGGRIAVAVTGANSAAGGPAQDLGGGTILGRATPRMLRGTDVIVGQRGRHSGAGLARSRASSSPGPASPATTHGSAARELLDVRAAAGGGDGPGRRRQRANGRGRRGSGPDRAGWIRSPPTTGTATYSDEFPAPGFRQQSPSRCCSTETPIAGSPFTVIITLF